VPNLAEPNIMKRVPTSGPRKYFFSWHVGSILFWVGLVGSLSISLGCMVGLTFPGVELLADKSCVTVLTLSSLFHSLAVSR